MKIVHLFSIYLFSSTPYPITGYLIFKDNSLFLRSTILLSIISIEVKRGEGKRDATSWNFNQRTIRKKKKKERWRRRQSWCLICVSKVPCLSEFRFVFSGISCYPCFYSITHLTNGDSTRHSLEKRREAADRS